jgi:chromosome segregation ATPase
MSHQQQQLLAALHAAAASLDERAASLQSAYNGLRDQVKSVVEELDRNESEIRRLQGELEQAKQEVQRLSAELKQERDTLAVVRAERNSFHRYICDQYMKDIPEEELRHWASDDNEEGCLELDQFIGEIEDIVYGRKQP